MSQQFKQSKQTNKIQYDAEIYLETIWTIFVVVLDAQFSKDLKSKRHVNSAC